MGRCLWTLEQGAALTVASMASVSIITSRTDRRWVEMKEMQAALDKRNWPINNTTEQVGLSPSDEAG